MVQRQADGSLTWEQEGQIMSVSKEDPNQYNPALETEDMQLSAKQKNKDAEDAYLTELHTAQVNVDASRPIPGIPEKPEYIVVTDPYKSGDKVTPGTAAPGLWPAPGLPDLKHKMIYPSGGVPPVEEEFVIEGAKPVPHAPVPHPQGAPLPPKQTKGSQH